MASLFCIVSSEICRSRLSHVGHCYVLKGTVSPDVGFSFRVYRIKSMFFFKGLLIVSSFLNFIVTGMFNSLFQDCFYRNDD
jgi:hypothetical protein